MPAHWPEVKWSYQCWLTRGELGLHRIGEGERRGQRAHHDGQLADRTVVVEPDEVASLQLFVPDPGLEDQGVVARVVGTDLADVPEVLEHRQDGLQDQPHRLAALVRPEHDGAVEHDVFAKERHGGVEVTGFDRAPERVHVSSSLRS